MGLLIHSIWHPSAVYSPITVAVAGLQLGLNRACLVQRGSQLLLYLELQVALAVSLSSRFRSNSVLAYDLYAGGPRPPLMIQDAQLVRRADGKPVQLNGVNW